MHLPDSMHFPWTKSWPCYVFVKSCPRKIGDVVRPFCVLPIICNKGGEHDNLLENIRLKAFFCGKYQQENSSHSSWFFACIFLSLYYHQTLGYAQEILKLSTLDLVTPLRITLEGRNRDSEKNPNA